MKDNREPHSLSWADLIWKAVSDRPRLSLVLLIVGLLIATIIYFDYYRPNRPGKEKTSLSEVHEPETPFSILSLFVGVSFEDSDISAPNNLRKVFVRSIYTIQLNRDFDEPTSIFQKAYTKTGASHIKRWAGTANEVMVSSGDNHFATDVFVKGKKGDIQNLAFGATLDFQFPLSKDRAIRDIVTMSPNEEWWGYTVREKCVIRVLTIAVESRTTPIRFSANRPLMLVKADGTLSTIEPEFSRDQSQHPGVGCIWARWHEVKPGELVALRFSW